MMPQIHSNNNNEKTFEHIELELLMQRKEKKLEENELSQLKNKLDKYKFILSLIDMINNTPISENYISDVLDYLTNLTKSILNDTQYIENNELQIILNNYDAIIKKILTTRQLDGQYVILLIKDIKKGI
jgi:AraC-like DNA-binding protein